MTSLVIKGVLDGIIDLRKEILLGRECIVITDVWIIDNLNIVNENLNIGEAIIMHDNWFGWKSFDGPVNSILSLLLKSI